MPTSRSGWVGPLADARCQRRAAGALRPASGGDCRSSSRDARRARTSSHETVAAAHGFTYVRKAEKGFHHAFGPLPGATGAAGAAP